MAVRQGFNLSKSERGLGACEECRQDADAAKKVEDRGGEQTGWSSLDSRTTVVFVAATADVVNKINRRLTVRTARLALYG